MPRISFVLAASLAALSLAVPISAQRLLPRSIQFKGDPEYTDQELLAAAGLKRGQTLAAADMNGYAQKLAASGVFDSVGYKFDGQDLIYTLTGDPALLPLRLGNLPFTPGPELDAQLHKRLPLYHGKVPTDGQLLDNLRQAFEAMLAAEGVKATVVAVPYTGPNDRGKVTAMSFTISAPAIRLGAVRVEGASMALQPRLRELVDVIANPLFDAETTPASLQKRFTDFYLNQGFAAVKVQAVRSGAVVITPGAILVPFKVSVQEGHLYRIASIHLPPGALVTQAEADKIVAAPDKLTMGEALPDVLTLICRRYQAKGYLDLVVNPQPSFDNAAGTVDYTIDVVSGPIYHVAYVKFDGAGDELRSHLMRQWQLMPGDPFDQTYLDTFLTRAESQDPWLRRSLAGALSTTETSADPVTHDVDITFRLAKP
jgi:outer membrane protein insertion porin family